MLPCSPLAKRGSTIVQGAHRHSWRAPGILGCVVQDGSHVMEQLTFRATGSNGLWAAGGARSGFLLNCPGKPALGTTGIHEDETERHSSVSRKAKPASTQTQGGEGRLWRFNSLINPAVLALEHASQPSIQITVATC